MTTQLQQNENGIQRNPIGTKMINLQPLNGTY